MAPKPLRRDAEHPSVLQNEISLLWKEQGEPRQVYLLLVHLDSGEVGVERETEVQTRRHSVLDVEAHVIEPGSVELASHTSSSR